MSGGSFDYLYHKIEDAGHQLLRDANNPVERVFAKHLLLVAKAMHDVEWVHSGDYSQDQATEAICKALAVPAKTLILNELIEQANDLIDKLKIAKEAQGE